MNQKRLRVWLKNGDKVDFDATGTGKIFDIRVTCGALLVTVLDYDSGTSSTARVFANLEWTNAEFDPVRW